MGFVSYLRSAWSGYTPIERRNIAIYIVGIMFYKLGLEAFNGSITTLATDRFTSQAFRKLGMLQGLNQAFQCVGSILIAPLIKRFPTRTVLASAVMIFGILTSILMIVDSSTGGEFRNSGRNNIYGNWNPNALFPIYCASGIAYGMVELIRRVIPRDIVGGDISKLRRMDSIVHIFYEVAGTAGAFATTYLVLRMGNNYSFLITPIFFGISCLTWSFVSVLNYERNLERTSQNYLVQIADGFKLFFLSIYRGAQIILTSRKYIWLPFGYSVALYAHRYLENSISPLIAKRVFNESAYSQILVGGSNFGELLGALAVFFLSDAVPTPLPWLRLDCLLLLIVWVTPFYTPPQNDARYAWALAAVFIPISFGWAAGDVSLAAYIQAMLARKESEHKDVSALGAVMACLYSTYIVLFAILNPTLGSYIDEVWAEDQSAHRALINIGGVQFTVICVVVLLWTLVPKGAIALNPKLLFDENLDEPMGDSASDSEKQSNQNKGGSKVAESEDGELEHRKSFVASVDVPVDTEASLRR